MKKIYIITDNEKDSMVEKLGFCSEDKNKCKEFLPLYGKKSFIEEVSKCDTRGFVEPVFIFVFNKDMYLEKNYAVEFCEDDDNWGIKIDTDNNFIVPICVDDIELFEAFLLAKQRLKNKI